MACLWLGLIGILLLCCFVEGIMLVRDRGTVASLIASAKLVKERDGLIAVILAAFSLILGKMQDVIPITYRKFTDENIHIAFCPSGGLGDYIISAKLLEELQSLPDCRITVFCEKMEYGKAIYMYRKNVDICEYRFFEKKRRMYDLALQVEHFVHVCNMNEKRLRRLSPVLYEKSRYIQDNWEALYVAIPQQCWREHIWFEKCKIFGLNRWTELRMKKTFQIEDFHVTIPMDVTYKTRWEETGISDKPYITFNYGADRILAEGTQIKIWPKPYYKEVLNMLRRSRPDLLLIQIGSSECERVSGADRYILGESLELTKWILDGARLHIDCEGGLVHLATQLGTKCIVMFGPTPMHMYAYERNINLKAQGCAYCMGLHENWAYQCLKTGGEAECMREIKPESVFRACMSVLNE